MSLNLKCDDKNIERIGIGSRLNALEMKSVDSQRPFLLGNCNHVQCKWYIQLSAIGLIDRIEMWSEGDGKEHESTKMCFMCNEWTMTSKSSRFSPLTLARTHTHTPPYARKSSWPIRNGRLVTHAFYFVCIHFRLMKRILVLNEPRSMQPLPHLWWLLFQMKINVQFSKHCEIKSNLIFFPFCEIQNTYLKLSTVIKNAANVIPFRLGFSIKCN